MSCCVTCSSKCLGMLANVCCRWEAVNSLEMLAGNQPSTKLCHITSHITTCQLYCRLWWVWRSGLWRNFLRRYRDRWWLCWLHIQVRRRVWQQCSQLSSNARSAGFGFEAVVALTMVLWPVTLCTMETESWAQLTAYLYKTLLGFLLHHENWGNRSLRNFMLSLCYNPEDYILCLQVDWHYFGSCIFNIGTWNFMKKVKLSL
jgi:hypothetical protein